MPRNLEELDAGQRGLEQRVTALEANVSRLVAAQATLDARLAQERSWRDKRVADSQYLERGWKKAKKVPAQYIRIKESSPQGDAWLATHGYPIVVDDGLYVVPTRGIGSFRNVGLRQFEVLTNGRHVTAMWPVSAPDLAEDMRIALARQIFGV